MEYRQPVNVLAIPTRWDALSPPPQPKRRADLLAAQLAVLGTATPETVFCKMVGDQVSVRRCLASQFDAKCLGCSAVSHLCHSCWVQPIVLPEMELCASCLEFALAEEKFRGLPQLDDERAVFCLVEKRKIQVYGCRRRQLRSTRSCFGCDQPSRICGCKEFPVCYPQDGYCRRCAVRTYGGETYVPVILQAHQPSRYQEICAIRRGGVPASKPALPPNEPPSPAEDAATIERTEVSDAVAWDAAVKMVEEYEEHGKASTGQNWLGHKMKMFGSKVVALQQRLEELGVLGPKRGSTLPRRLLIRSLDQLERDVRPQLQLAGAPGAPAVAPSNEALALRQFEEHLNARPVDTLPSGQIASQLLVLCAHLEPLGYPTFVALLRRASDGLNAFGQITGQLSGWLKRSE